MPMAGDAGVRRYHRLRMGEGGTRVIMDAPGQIETCRAYLRVGQLMAEAGVHVPQVHAVDLRSGLLLLEDLGTQSYLDALLGEHPAPATLIEAALEALVRWQVVSRPGVLPKLNEECLLNEMNLFPLWYVRKVLNYEPNGAWLERWQQGCHALITFLLDQPEVWVHRDFMGRNLLLSEPLPGVIDFQDASSGPVTYDVLSLLRDAFYSFSDAQERRYLDFYAKRCAAMGVPLPDNLPQAVDCMGVQRHFKVLGIFARLAHRDDKPHYLTDAPRFFTYLERELKAHPDLAVFSELLAELP